MSQLEQQMRHRDREMVPAILVKAMFGLMAASVALVAWAQLTDHPQLGVLDEAPVVAEREVVLTGNRSGVYTVTDAAGATLAMSSDDRAGFIGVMGRVIDRERGVRGLPLDAPVTVVRRENGNIAILDETTGRHVELIGYGADNVAAFAGLLD
jgi:putative photosynthetic complex assembly protein